MHDLYKAEFYDNIKLGKKEIQGRFVIPSGVRCSYASVIERYFKIDSVGIITTKSISLEPKIGYKEPIYAKYGENSYINAVGLENPGAAVFKEELSKIEIPGNKFLLISIFGKNEEEFYNTAAMLSDYSDGFELNMSCPHAKGYGLQIGSDIDLVSRITKKISSGFDLPVFVKLSAAIPNVAITAEAAIKNGAIGITVTNTIGPTIDYVFEKPVLSNIVGGMSGEAIRPLGLKALCDIRKTIGEKPIIIGMGGILNKEHIKSYNVAGADFFGIGSALTNLNTEETKTYFNNLQEDIISETTSQALKIKQNMEYKKCFIEENTSLTNVLHKIKLSKWEGYEENKNTACKFYFIMIPETGEKPFALFSYDTREFIIKNVGYFTNKLTSLKKGDMVLIRGPYGREMPDYKDMTINFVAGGTGISPVYEIAKKYSKSNKIQFFFGAKTSKEIFDIERYEKIGKVWIVTEDGSLGIKGFVSDIIENHPFGENKNQLFVNVGPRVMIEKCYGIELRNVSDENIWVSIEYQTSCGVGICGKCATESGMVSCVDGPFLRVTDALKIKECKHR